MSRRLNILHALNKVDSFTKPQSIWGAWIEAGLVMLFTLGGLIGIFWILLFNVYPEWRQIHDFQRATCRIVQVRIAQQDNGRGSLPQYRPEVQIEYNVKQAQYKTWAYDFNALKDGGYDYTEPEALSALRPFVVGEKFYCWYDPDNPARAVLFKGWTFSNIWMLVVPLSLLFLGLGPLVHLSVFHGGRSREKAALLAQQTGLAYPISVGVVPEAENVPVDQAAGGDPPAEVGKTAVVQASAAGIAFPAIPSIREIMDSPGVRYRYRLPLDNSPLRSMGVLGAVCLGWNFLALMFLSVALGCILDGTPDWGLLFFVCPFMLAGLALLAYFMFKVQLLTQVGPTLLEINDMPLVPGQETQVLLIQTGTHQIKELSLKLVCEEEAIFSYGTDIRSETAVVYCQELFSRQNFEIQKEESFEQAIPLTVPLFAMHSFESLHNRIRWRLVVEGVMLNIAPFTRRFSLAVVPDLVQRRPLTFPAALTDTMVTPDTIMVTPGTIDMPDTPESPISNDEK